MSERRIGYWFAPEQVGPQIQIPVRNGCDIEVISAGKNKPSVWRWLPYTAWMTIPVYGTPVVLARYVEQQPEHSLTLKETEL